MTIVELVDLDKRRNTRAHALLVTLDNEKQYVIGKFTTQRWARGDNVELLTQDSSLLMVNVSRNEKVQAKPYEDR